MRAVLLSTKTKNKTWVFMAGLALAVVGLVSGLALTATKASAAISDCDSNSIIYCGVTSASDFINKVRNGDSHNGHHDLQAVYAHYGLSSADYANFAKQAVQGMAYKNGDIRIRDAKGNYSIVVATAGKSIGRQKDVQGASPFSVAIGGTTYWGNTNDQAFATDSLPVYVWLNAQGTMQFAVLKPCGNPEFGNVVNTSASCRELTKTPVAGQLNTYDFTATANVSGNASMNKYVFDFGDGTTKTVSSTATSVTLRHTYTKGGTFTAKVTEFASVPGNNSLPLPVVSTCSKTVSVVLPYYSCASLKAFTVDEQKYTYKFTATASNGGGATFTSTDYNFGDSTAVQNVKTTDGKTTSVTHTFAKNGDYNVSALLHFMVNGKAVTATYKCTTNKQGPTCKPGILVGDTRCNPCPTNPAVSVADTQNCPMVEAAATSLPNTGAGNTVAIFAAVVVAGFLAYRHILFRRHRAAFLAAQNGISPLPLADALDAEDPLRSTPLAPKSRSFRRKRQF